MENETRNLVAEGKSGTYALVLDISPSAAEKKVLNRPQVEICEEVTNLCGMFL